MKMKLVLSPSKYEERYSCDRWQFVPSPKKYLRLGEYMKCMPENYGLYLEVNEDLAYRLQDRYGRLILTVEKAFLPEPTELTIRFMKIRWRVLFRAEYKNGSKEPKVLFDGFGKGLPYVLKMIRDRKIKPIMISDSNVIHSVFPNVFSVYSLQMFDYIYRNKGFGPVLRLPRFDEDLLLDHRPDDRPMKGERNYKELSPAWQHYKEVMDYYPIPIVASTYRYDNGYFYRYNVRYIDGHREEQIEGRTYGTRGKHINGLVDKAVILRIAVDLPLRTIVFLFCPGYVACNYPGEVENLLAGSARLFGDSRQAIMEFDREYPEYLIGQYMERSDNVLVPLLAGNYHFGMELAAKSGAAAIAQNCERLKAFEVPPDKYGNLKKLLGLPPAVLRSLGGRRVYDSDLERLKEVYGYNPEFLHFDPITPSMLWFLERVDVTNSGRRAFSIKVRGMTDKKVLRILRYLQKHPDEGAYYLDYLRACDVLEEYIYGLTPRIPIKDACESAAARAKALTS